MFNNNGLESAPLMKRRKLMNGGNCVNGMTEYQICNGSIKPDESKDENINKNVQQAQGIKRCCLVETNVQKR